ncbi:MAG: response regulator [Thermoflexales bacterium]|nr:response regulator [Thermoflexales bacterium]
MAEGQKTVVCVEDEPDMIYLIEFLLAKKGYQVIGANSGREGLETIQRVKPDLVLLDLMMPDIDGEQVCRAMKADKRLKNIPIIVVTAHVTSIDKTLWQEVIKVNDYITKPFDSQKLLESIERVFARGA